MGGAGTGAGGGGSGMGCYVRFIALEAAVSWLSMRTAWHYYRGGSGAPPGVRAARIAALLGGLATPLVLVAGRAVSHPAWY